MQWMLRWSSRPPDSPRHKAAAAVDYNLMTAIMMIQTECKTPGVDGVLCIEILLLDREVPRYCSWLNIPETAYVVDLGLDIAKRGFVLITPTNDYIYNH